MSFKDQMAADIDSLFDTDEMAEETTVNGLSVVIIKEPKISGKEKGYGSWTAHQVNNESIKFFIREANMDAPPVVGAEIEVGGVYYSITTASFEVGFYAIGGEVRK
jgi:hypothetical protein